MDEIDEKLLTELAANARVPVATLAKKLGLARSTVQARIERLERRGIIAGYGLRIGPNAGIARIRATVLIKIEPRATPGVLQRLAILPQVERAHTASGRFDLIATVAARDTAALDQTLNAIGAIPGVTGTESLIQLATKIDRAL
jgi:DNA-binding Lrp family transcriptional regulator